MKVMIHSYRMKRKDQLKEQRLLNTMNKQLIKASRIDKKRAKYLKSKAI